MRIVLATDNFYPELSGITDSLVLFIKELTARGHEVLVLAPRYSGPELSLNHLTVCRLPSLPLPNSPTGQGRIALPLGRGYRAIKRFKPDLIHTNSPFGAGLEALATAKLLKLPFLGTNHTPIAEFMTYGPVNLKILTALTCRYFAWYYNRCQFVSAPSRALLNEMAQFGFKQKSEAVSNPIDSTGFKPAASPAEKLALKKLFKLSDQTILYTGRLAAEKHVDVIIRALAQVRIKFPQAMLAVTGHGAAEADLKKLAVELNLENSVRFFGYVSASDLQALYRASDVFAIMSTAEAQSLSLFQAFASGLPAIGARARALPEYISPTNGVVVTPGDDQELAAGIINLFNQPDLTKRLGLGGITTASQFSPATVTARWEKIYENELNHPRL